MIIVGSSNPAKVKPVRDVMRHHWPDLEVLGVDVPSGVSEQPIGFEETSEGARTRARGALAHPGALWGVGLEGGVTFSSSGNAYLFGVVVVAHAGRESAARSASLQLPRWVGERIRRGEELGPIMDELSGVRNSKQKMGAVGLLTGGLVERADVWTQTLALALAPYLRPDLYLLDEQSAPTR